MGDETQAAIGRSICKSIGQAIVNTNTPEASTLLRFLAAVFENEYGKEMETDIDLGLMWTNLLDYSDSNPAEELSEKFNELNDAWHESKERLLADYGEQIKVLFASADAAGFGEKLRQLVAELPKK